MYAGAGNAAPCERMRAGWLSHQRCDRSGSDPPLPIVAGEPVLQQALASPARQARDRDYARRLPLAHEAAEEQARSRQSQDYDESHLSYVRKRTERIQYGADNWRNPN